MALRSRARATLSVPAEAVVVGKAEPEVIGEVVKGAEVAGAVDKTDAELVEPGGTADFIVDVALEIEDVVDARLEVVAKLLLVWLSNGADDPLRKLTAGPRGAAEDGVAEAEKVVDVANPIGETIGTRGNSVLPVCVDGVSEVEAVPEIEDDFAGVVVPKELSAARVKELEPGDTKLPVPRIAGVEVDGAMVPVEPVDAEIFGKSVDVIVDERVEDLVRVAPPNAGVKLEGSLWIDDVEIAEMFEIVVADNALLGDVVD